MKLAKLKKCLLLAVILTCICQISFSQSERNKWVFGLGMNAIDFFSFDTEGNGNSGGFFNEVTNAANHWNVGGPKIHATRHVWKRLSVEGAFSYSSLTRFGATETEEASYTAFDINAQYALFNLENKFNIALSLGGGYASAYNSGGTLNAGGNLNWWFSGSFGLNVQGMVKYNSPDYSLAPHMFYGFSLVFRPNGDGLGGDNQFIWRNGM